MRFTRIVMAYATTGIFMLGSGIVPFERIGVGTLFISGPDNPAVVSVYDKTETGCSGMLCGVMDPVQNALNTLTGGALMAVWNIISKFIGFYAWPVTTANYLNAPSEVVLVATLFVIAFTLSIVRVFRASA